MAVLAAVMRAARAMAAAVQASALLNGLRRLLKRINIKVPYIESVVNFAVDEI